MVISMSEPVFSGWFYDMLTVHQSHVLDRPFVKEAWDVNLSDDGLVVLPVDPEQELPRVCQHVYQRADTDTGEARIWQSPRQFEGSYRTSLRVSCDGYDVKVSGNPSKFCRLDNLFGYRTLDECVAVFNCVLEHLGLPPFTKATYYKPRQNKEERAAFVTDGALISLVHVTRNLCVGDPSYVLQYLSALTGQSMVARGPSTRFGSNLGQLHPNGRTVDWFRGSRRLYVKMYDKAFEMTLHKPDFQMTVEEVDYLKRLQQWLHDVGCVREEFELKQMTLNDKQMHIYGFVTDEQIMAYVEGKSLLSRVEVTTMSLENVADDLMRMGYPERTAKRMQMIANNYYHGVSMDTLFGSKAAKNKAAAILRELNIDIKTPMNVTRLLPRVQVIELRPLPVPSFYRMPSLDDVKRHLVITDRRVA
jgi:hypothetical protein